VEGKTCLHVINGSFCCDCRFVIYDLLTLSLNVES
jgi:hypothetical protein